MPEPTSPSFRDNTSAGHLSVHLDPSRAADIPFLFEQQQRRLGPAFLASFGSHVAAVLLAYLLVHLGGQAVQTSPVLPDFNANQIVWLNRPGPGGGGGGGGNRMQVPPRKAELPGKDKITVPVVKPPKLEPVQQTKNEPNPAEQLVIPAKTLAAATDSLPGVIEAPPAPPTLSLGAGVGGGTGGGVYRPGSGVTLPRVLFEKKPQYTSDAMRAKVQGTVLLQCVVKQDGTVGDIQVIRSLDSAFGLDQEAVKAARQWRFVPGTRLGEPVPVLVTIELTFTLR